MARSMLARAMRNASPVPLTRPASKGSGWGDTAPGALTVTQAVSTVFGIVHTTSNSTSQVDWHLWRKAPSGKDEDRVEVTNHPALVVWNKPNPFYTRQEFVEAIQQHVDLTGECWWSVAYAGKMPIELWPIRPDHMTPAKHPTEFIQGYVYRAPDGTDVPLKLNEIIYLRMPDPANPYRGLGPMQSAFRWAGLSQAAAQWNRMFFENDATPAGILTLPDVLPDTQYKKVVARWNEEQRGIHNAHRVRVMEGGATYAPVSSSQKDMQFVELIGLTRDMIREAFTINKFQLGQTEDVNRASALAAGGDFAKRLLVPRLERIKGALNNDFLPLFGGDYRNLEFDYENPEPQDAEDVDRERTSKTNAWATLVNAGADPDDASAAVGLPLMKMRQKEVMPA